MMPSEIQGSHFLALSVESQDVKDFNQRRMPSVPKEASW
jgi:hypothetical protein